MSTDFKSALSKQINKILWKSECDIKNKYLDVRIIIKGK